MNEAIDQVATAVREELGPREAWARWPGGWPGDIEAALVDAVFSARAVYRSRNGSGVHRRLTTWRATRDRRVWSLPALVEEIDRAGGPTAWAERFGNTQVSPGRSASAPGGPTKAAAVQEAAKLLAADAPTPSIVVADDIDDGNVEAVRAMLRTVHGLGYATSNYFLMLLGWPGVKPDRMVHRFIERATGRRSTDAEAEQVITAVAARLGSDGRELEHAIWKVESDRAGAARQRSRHGSGRESPDAAGAGDAFSRAGDREAVGA